MKVKAWGMYFGGIVLGLLVLGFIVTGNAWADAGGWPTATPSPSPVPTWTFPVFPTWTPTLSQPGWVFVTPPPSDQKGVPTSVMLSEEEILATLQATQQAVQSNKVAGTPGWMIPIAIFLALALAILIVFAIFRWLRSST